MNFSNSIECLNCDEEYCDAFFTYYPLYHEPPLLNQTKQQTNNVVKVEREE